MKKIALVKASKLVVTKPPTALHDSVGQSSVYPVPGWWVVGVGGPICSQWVTQPDHKARLSGCRKVEDIHQG